MEIKVVGPGCAKCNKVEETVKEVLNEMGIDANVSKVTDFREIVKSGITNTPGLIVNDKVKISGKVPTKAEVSQILTTEMAE